MMDPERRRFVPVSSIEEAAGRPVLSIGETLELKGVSYKVHKMKNGGRLRIVPATNYRIGFGVGDLVTIKGVEFRVTFDAGKIVGMRMAATSAVK